MLLVEQRESEIWSNELTGLLASSEAYLRADLLLGFVALPGEPDLQKLYDDALGAGKRVGFPVCMPDGNLDFRQVDSQWRSHLVRNRWNIGEPDCGRFPSVESNTGDRVVILVPALAFTIHRERLGRGKGFYDRFLAQKRPNMISIGVCFDHQVLPSVPLERGDMGVDLLMTPSGSY